MNFQNLFLDLKIGTKLGVGFAVIILLSIVTAVISFIGLQNVKDRVDKGDDANRLIKMILDTRRSEKNFILRGNNSDKVDVENNIMYIENQALETKEQFKQKENKDQMDAVIDESKVYLSSFNVFADLENKKNQSMTSMRQSARTALDEIDDIRSDQKAKMLDEISKKSRTMEKRLSKADDANRLVKLFLEARKNEKEYIISNGEQKWLNTHTDLLFQIRNLAADLKIRFVDPLNDKQVDDAVLALNNYENAFQDFRNYMKEQEEAEEKMLVAAREVEQEGNNARSDQKAEMESSMASANTLIITFTFLSLILGIFFAIIIARSISRPIIKLTMFSKMLAEGNLTQSIDVNQNDEIGAMIQSFNQMNESVLDMTQSAEKIANGDLRVTITPRSEQDSLGKALSTMVENLRVQFNEISTGVNTLSSATSEIMASVSQLASGAAESATSISQATSTIEEIKQTAEVSNKKATQVSEAGQQITSISADGTKTIEDTRDGMSKIKQQMESIADIVVRLSEQSQSIGSIAGSVNDLAEQSNLLAVNASIEAAKAGEHGKGFAVVAQEIKNLAERSKESTSQIRTILVDIQKAISSAVMATEQGGKVADEGLKLSLSASEVISTLASSVEQAAQSNIQIAASSQQQVIGMDQITSAMENIRESSLQTAASTKQTEDSVSSIHNLGEKLQQILTQYKLK